MTEELEPIFSNDGDERKCGLLLPPENFVSAMQTYEAAAFPILDDAEIRQRLTSPDRTPRSVIFSDPHWVREADQKAHGSCQGWASASVYSKTRYLRGITDGTVFSGSYAYSLVNNGQDNGSALDRGMVESMENGFPPASVCGPNLIYRRDTKQFDSIAAKHKGLACYPASTKQGFRSAIALGFLAVVAVQVDKTKFVNWKGNGILPAFHGKGNHAIHCDFMKLVNGTEVFEVVNNWGLGWSAAGRADVTWDSFAETFPVHSFYVVTSTSEAE